MPQPGAIRIGDQGDWERWEPEVGPLRFLPGSQGGWVPLPLDDPQRAQLDTLLASGLFDDVQNDPETGEVVFRTIDRWLDQRGAYYSLDLALVYLRDMEIAGPRPEGHPASQGWPEYGFPTAEEAAEEGLPRTARVVKAPAPAASPLGTGKERVIPGEEVGGFPGSFFIQDEAGNLRPYTPPSAPSAPSINDLIMEAVVAGDFSKAIALDDFRSRPSHMEALRFALPYAESEAELKSLYNLARGFTSPTPYGMPSGFTFPGPNYQQGVSEGAMEALPGFPAERPPLPPLIGGPSLETPASRTAGFRPIPSGTMEADLAAALGGFEAERGALGPPLTGPRFGAMTQADIAAAQVGALPEQAERAAPQFGGIVSPRMNAMTEADLAAAQVGALPEQQMGAFSEQGFRSPLEAFAPFLERQRKRKARQAFGPTSFGKPFMLPER